MPDTTKPKNQPENALRPDGLAMRIKQARERKGVSLSDLHKSTGLSRTALHDYESGRTKPGARELRILCETLDATPNWLLFGTDEPFKKRHGLKALLKLKDSPAMLAVSMLALPVVIQSFAEEDLEALLTLISTILEAKDRETYNHISAMAEVLTGMIGTGSPEDLSAFAEKSKSPEFIAEVQQQVRLRMQQGT